MLESNYIWPELWTVDPAKPHLTIGTLPEPPNPVRLDKLVYTPPEVARLLNMNAGTVRAWCLSGKLKAVNVGKRGRKFWKIGRDAVREVLDNRERPPERPTKSRVKPLVQRY